MRGAKSYRNIEEFEREEIRSQYKAGWSLEDLYHEASFERRETEADGDPSELSFE